MIIFDENLPAMLTTSFKLKDPQSKITPAKQVPTLVYLIASFEYTETKPDGSLRYIPLKYSTALKIKPCFWNGKGKGNPEYRARQTNQFEHSTFNIRLDDINNACKTVHRELLNNGKQITPEIFRNALDKKLITQNLKKEPKKETFGEYIDRYNLEAKNGIRTTVYKNPFKLYTLKNFKTFAAQFKLFELDKGRSYDFNDIDLVFYNDFMLFFNKKGYSKNTSGRHIKSLKMIMNAARIEGLHNNSIINEKAFRATSVETDSIYLSEKELKLIYNLDLSKDPLLDVARDVFLVGCWTAQRFSDYSRISKENIMVLNGGVKVIDLIQVKTGQRVKVPIRPELEKILKKYDYTLPKTYEQKLNKRIKTVGERAELNEKVRITTYPGGNKEETDYFKYDLIKTHTARRSGCTNMHLAGIPSISIMKISGHTTESQFLRYIKVEKDETANILALHPYFTQVPIIKTKRKPQGK